MEHNRHSLQNHWTLVMGGGCRLYSNENSYVVFDRDGDMLIGLTVQENIVEVSKSSWHLKYHLDIHRKEIVIFNEPDEV